MPLPDVLGLMVRERLTGQAPPDGSKAMVDGMRPEIEAKAGRALDRLAAAMDDQSAFGKIARTIIRDLEVGNPDAADTPENGGDDDPPTEDQPDAGDTGDNDDQSGEGDSSPSAERSDAEVEAAGETLTALQAGDEADSERRGAAKGNRPPDRLDPTPRTSAKANRSTRFSPLRPTR